MNEAIKGYVAGLPNANEYPVQNLKRARIFDTPEEAENFAKISPWANNLIIYEITVRPLISNQ